MRQCGALGERCAALVVDEEKGHSLRAVPCCHREDPGLEELALASSGGTTDQGVGTLCPQIEIQGIEVCPPDHGPESVLSSELSPTLVLAQRA